MKVAQGQRHGFLGRRAQFSHHGKALPPVACPCCHSDDIRQKSPLTMARPIIRHSDEYGKSRSNDYGKSHLSQWHA